MNDSNSSVRWLHISDFHFKSPEPYDQDVVLKAFLNSLPKLVERHGQPQLIFATGDIGHSGKREEYLEATKFFDRLLSILELDRDRLFVVPGNHDIDRSRGLGLARTLTTAREADDYFNPSNDFVHIRERLAAFTNWYNTYFQGIRKFPTNTTFVDRSKIDIGQSTLEIVTLNSATFCYDDNDHGKLFIGRRSLDAGIEEMPKLDVAMRIALVHHPIDWLSSVEQTNVRALLRDTFDCILSGHLHQADADSVVGLTGETVHLTAGAMYQTRDWPNTAAFCTLRDQQITVTPIHYVDKPRPTWTLDTGYFLDDPGFEGHFPIRKRVDRRGTVVAGRPIMEPAHQLVGFSDHLSKAIEEFEADLFVTPSGKRLYVEPRLQRSPQTTTETLAENVSPVSISEIVQDTRSCIIDARSEYGGSTVARRIALEITRMGGSPLFKDARNLPNYRKKLEVEFPNSVRQSGINNTLILDNFDPEKDERLLKEIFSTEWFSRLIIISVNRGLKPTNAASLNGLLKDFQTFYLWPLSRPDIREFASILFESNDDVFVSGIVDKVYGDLLGLCIPLTPSNIVMYLTVLYKEGEFHPINRIDILNRYIIETLRKPSDAYIDSFNPKNKMDVFSAFSFEMFEKSKSGFTEQEWHSFVKSYKDETLFDFDGSSLLYDLCAARIVIKFGVMYYVKYAFYFNYFLGRYIANRENVLRAFLNEKKYLRLPGIVEAISGLSANNTYLLTTLVDELEDIEAQFGQKYIPSAFDPLAHARWPDNHNTEDRLWETVQSEVEAGPRSTAEIDTVKTSLFAEARTQHQEVTYAEFLRLESSLFLLARLLTDALKNSDDANGDVKVRAQKAIYRSHLVAFQLGCVFADKLVSTSVFQWGGVLFLGFDRAADGLPIEEDGAKIQAIGRVITSLCTSIVAQCREESGAAKLSPVFRAIDAEKSPLGIEVAMNFACLLNARGNGYYETLENLIQRTDRNSYYMSVFLNILMAHLRLEILPSKDRDSAKRLVALIRTKRMLNKNTPGAKIVDRVLDKLEQLKHFSRNQE